MAIILMPGNNMLARLTICCVCVIVPFLAATGVAQEPLLADAALTRFLERGKWSPTADDNAADERLDAGFVSEIVHEYRKDPRNSRRIAALGLLVLGTAIAEWGADLGSEELEDPAGKKWQGPGHFNGKHVMSYARGGVGVPHADSGLLRDFFNYLKEHHMRLAPEPERFFKLMGRNFDVLYANGGHCNRPVTAISTDLNGSTFGHSRNGYAGESYCKRFNNRKTTEEDWRIFRHWVRDALRLESVQRWLIEEWLRRFWLESYEMVMKAPGGTVEEAMINARIRNSSSATADCAIRYARGRGDKLKAQMEAYTLSKCEGQTSHKRRFGHMLRPVKLYLHFSR